MRLTNKQFCIKITKRNSSDSYWFCLKCWQTSKLVMYQLLCSKHFKHSEKIVSPKIIYKTEHLPNALKYFLILNIKSKDNDNPEAGYFSLLTIIEALAPWKQRYINQSKFETSNLVLKFYQLKMTSASDVDYSQRNLTLLKRYNR